MPESRGGGRSGGDRWTSSIWREHKVSVRTVGAEDEDDDDDDDEHRVSSFENPDTPEVDLKKKKKRYVNVFVKLAITTCY